MRLRVIRDDDVFVASADGVLSYGMGDSEDAAVADFWCSVRTDHALLRKAADKLSKPLRREMDRLEKLLYHKTGGRMSDDITHRIDGIRARVEEATPGPWVWEWLDDERHDDMCLGTDGIVLFEGAVLTCSVCASCRAARATRKNNCTLPSPGDAAFIAHAREDIPWLLEQLGRMMHEEGDTCSECAHFSMCGNTCWCALHNQGEPSDCSEFYEGCDDFEPRPTVPQEDA